MSSKKDFLREALRCLLMDLLASFCQRYIAVNLTFCQLILEKAGFLLQVPCFFFAFSAHYSFSLSIFPFFFFIIQQGLLVGVLPGVTFLLFLAKEIFDDLLFSLQLFFPDDLLFSLQLFFPDDLLFSFQLFFPDDLLFSFQLFFPEVQRLLTVVLTSQLK